MAEIQVHSPGSFCWADLATTDVERAKRVYGELFQWGFKDVPAGDGMVYTMALVRGLEVAGLYQMDPDEREKGWAPCWRSYVAVDDADASAARAAELGAEIIAPPFDVHDAGRMAVIRDPGSAVLSLWQPRQHAGATLMGEPGSICWNELLTRDVDRAGSFYMKLFGWQPCAMETGGTTYTVFKRGDRQEAGMMAMTGAGGPPYSWLVYLMVQNCDASLAKAERFGVQIIKGATDIPGIGRFAMLQDPQGAVFAIFQPSGA